MPLGRNSCGCRPTTPETLSKVFHLTFPSLPPSLRPSFPPSFRWAGKPEELQGGCSDGVRGGARGVHGEPGRPQRPAALLLQPAAQRVSTEELHLHTESVPPSILLSSIHPYICQCIHPSILLSSIHPSICHPPIHPSFSPSSVCPSVNASILSSIHPSIIHASIHLSAHASILPSIYQSTRPCIHPSIHSSICPSIHPSTLCDPCAHLPVLLPQPLPRITRVSEGRRPGAQRGRTPSAGEKLQRRPAAPPNTVRHSPLAPLSLPFHSPGFIRSEKDSDWLW